MKNLILYIKTYKQDQIPFKKLVESINKYNKDLIPLLVSVNNEDFEYFKNFFPNLDIISDSKISTCEEKDGWRYQQIIKSQVHKLNITHNYICLDSDSYFIRDFYISDFMYNDTIPYTIIHNQKDLFEWTDNNLKNLKGNPKEYFYDVCKKIMNKFNRNGIYYDFGPCPVIWSTKVWKSFEDEFLLKHNKSFSEIIAEVPSEFTWYGEWLLYSKKIEIYPRSPLFKVFHYEKQYKDFIKSGYKIESLKENYLGVVMQSNWTRKKPNKFLKFLKKLK